MQYIEKITSITKIYQLQTHHTITITNANLKEHKTSVTIFACSVLFTVIVVQPESQPRYYQIIVSTLHLYKETTPEILNI
jgi:hypothetical protein